MKHWSGEEGENVNSGGARTFSRWWRKHVQLCKALSCLRCKCIASKYINISTTVICIVIVRCGCRANALDTVAERGESAEKKEGEEARRRTKKKKLARGNLWRGEDESSEERKKEKTKTWAECLMRRISIFPTVSITINIQNLYLCPCAPLSVLAFAQPSDKSIAHNPPEFSCFQRVSS